jgi:hypothetical protein
MSERITKVQLVRDLRNVKKMLLKADRDPDQARLAFNEIDRIQRRLDTCEILDWLPVTEPPDYAEDCELPVLLIEDESVGVVSGEFRRETDNGHAQRYFTSQETGHLLVDFDEFESIRWCNWPTGPVGTDEA